jgi:hypothetical protein
VDLLPERSATLSNWLKKHPGENHQPIAVVNMLKELPKVRRGCQVADRWHLVKNPGGSELFWSKIEPVYLPLRRHG